MATSPAAGTRIKPYLAVVAVVTLLAGCSGGGHKTGHGGLPTPAAGKVAAFDLGALSDTYDLNEDVMSGDTLVTTGRSGDVYMVQWDGADLRRRPADRRTPGRVARHQRGRRPLVAQGRHVHPSLPPGETDLHGRRGGRVGNGVLRHR